MEYFIIALAIVSTAIPWALFIIERIKNKEFIEIKKHIGDLRELNAIRKSLQTGVDTLIEIKHIDGDRIVYREPG